MAKAAALGANFYIGGNNVSGDVGSLTIGGGPAVLDVTDITQSAHSRLGGLRDGKMDLSVYFDPSVAHPVLSALPTADTIATFMVPALAVGAPAACLNAKQVTYDGTRGTDGSFTFAVNCTANGFGLEWGVQLTAGLRTTPGGTDFGIPSIDTGGALSFGAQAYLHVTAFTGTSATVVVQDSADNATFAAVAGLSFTVTAAPFAARVAISNTATVRQYVRAAINAGTYTSMTWALIVVKNPIAGVVF